MSGEGARGFTPERGDPVIVAPYNLKRDFLLGVERNQNRYFCRGIRISRRSHSPPRKINIRTRSPSTIRTQGLSFLRRVRHRWQKWSFRPVRNWVFGEQSSTLHFNGPNNGQGNYIWSQGGRGRLGGNLSSMKNAGTIQLVFSDNGQGNGRRPRRSVSGRTNDRYWSFTGQLCLTNALELSKTTNRLRNAAGGPRLLPTAALPAPRNQEFQ